MIDLSDTSCLERYPSKALLKAIVRSEDQFILTAIINRLESLKVSGGANAVVGQLGFEDLEHLQVAIDRQLERLASVEMADYRKKQKHTSKLTRGPHVQEANITTSRSYADDRIHQGVSPQHKRRTRRREET